MAVLVPDIDFQELGYIAPTVYLRGDRYISNYNYYATLDGAINKWKFLNNKGGSSTVPAGIKYFSNNQTAQTFGINCDFYVLVGGAWSLTNYLWIKQNINSLPPCVFRFVTTDGGGTYYAIFDKYYFGVSATSVKEVDPQKLAALDGFFREAQILKYRYNAFVGFLNTLAVRELNSVEQRIYNEGLLMLNQLSQQINTVRSIAISYGQQPVIGFPVLLIIIIVAILSAATAWTVTAVTSEKEKTKRINDSYDLTKWIATKKQEIALQVSSGQISQQSANGINSTLDNAAAVANNVATNAAKSKTSLGSIADIAKWGVVGYLAYLFFNRSKQKRINA